MSWIAVGVAGTLVGGAVSANGAKKSQQQANATNERLADEKNAFDWNSYLLQRGINAGGTAQPGEIPVGGTAVNTSLPIWATINGQPAEQALLNKLFQTSGLVAPTGTGGLSAQPKLDASGVLGSDAALQEYYNSNPAFAAEYNRHMGWIAQNSPGTDRRSPLQWLRDGIRDDPTGAQALQSYVAQKNQAIDDAIAAAQSEGETQSESTTSLDPAYLDLQRKAYASVNDLFDGRYLDQQLAALAPILSARTQAAQDIYGAQNDAATSLYDATKAGANSIYDADLLQADTYQQSAQQALTRILNQNSANRARQGFVGSGSGDALTRARLMADYTQQGAGVRAGAGQSLAQRIAGADRELAGLKGGAGVTRATSLGGANEQDAISRLALLTDDIGRRLSGVGLPGALANNDLSIRQANASGAYADIDALLSRLNGFKTSGTPSSLVTPNIQPVINSGQVAGGAISSLASAFGSYANNQQLLGAINGLNKQPSPTSWSSNGGGSLASPSSGANLGMFGF